MIELRDAGIALAGRYLFRHMSWQLARGQILAVLGRNGQGKTTLLRGLLGLQDWSEGHVRIGGSPGYVPQRMNTTFDFSVLDIVLTGRARHLGLFQSPGVRDQEIARQALGTLGIAGLAGRRIDELSGGERQLVFVARALASECDLLVLDEPTSSLDYQNQELILSVLGQLSAERGLTIVFSSHYPQHALLIADQVLLLDRDHGYYCGAVDAAVTEHRLSALYGVRMRRFDLPEAGGSQIVPIFQTHPAAGRGL